MSKIVSRTFCLTLSCDKWCMATCSYQTNDHHRPRVHILCCQQTQSQSGRRADVGLCVTTHDWNNDGAPGLTRLPAGSTVYYVRRVSLDSSGEVADADLAWLRDNIFGSSHEAVIQAFRNLVLALPFTGEAAARKQYSAVYWIWPVFTWPNTPPINLVDKTVVSLAWSLAPHA